MKDRKIETFKNPKTRTFWRNILSAGDVAGDGRWSSEKGEVGRLGRYGTTSLGLREEGRMLTTAQWASRKSKPIICGVPVHNSIKLWIGFKF